MKQRPYRSVPPGTVLLIRQIIVGLLIAAFFGMLITSVWYVTRASALTISEVAVYGGETIPHSEIEAIVRDQLQGSYVRLVPRTFVFTYPHTDIIDALLSHERIKEASAVRSGGKKLIVTFSEYTPQALWCKGTDETNCFFLDEHGYSFSPAPALTGGSFVRLVSIGNDPKLHTEAIPLDYYRTVQALLSEFSRANWFVRRVEVDAAGDAFLHIVDGGEFKVSLKQSTKETVDNLLTVLGSDTFAHLRPGNFEYIDLRFGSKVFVNEVTIEAATKTDSSTSPESPGEDNALFAAAAAASSSIDSQ